ncbi:hypothetical protein GCM10009757_40110 [Streptomyces cheonanensis]|uniref:Histone deacetylase n=1 Tax=Streptomyces cheonanensis TaxID=312720 RepID=A0ABP5GWD2_9ACTN
MTEPAARWGTSSAGVSRLWYVAYGSNTHAARLAAYLRGGRSADGGDRTYPGCRDPRPPARTRAVWLPGTLYFATRSPVWGGGRAFYDPDAPGRVPARGYLLTVGQFSDIAHQEMFREPGTDLDLRGVLRDGRDRLGPGRYETLVRAGTLDGLPMLTFTAPWSAGEVPPVPPSARYLRRLGAGIAEAHGWPPERVAGFLASCPGAAGHWTARAVTRVLTGEDTGDAS